MELGPPPLPPLALCGQVDELVQDHAVSLAHAPDALVYTSVPPTAMTYGDTAG